MSQPIQYVDIGTVSPLTQMGDTDEFVIRRYNTFTGKDEIRRITKADFWADVTQSTGEVNWNSLISIPAAVEALANATGNGFFVATVAGMGAFRSMESASLTRLIITNKDGQLGNPTFDLAKVTNFGGGALLKTTFDQYGRMIGSSTPSTDDLIEGEKLYFTEQRAAEAAPVQDAPNNDIPHVRKHGQWVEIPQSASQIDGGYF